MVPSLREWHKEYQDQGLVIIGNHYPEFSYEKDLDYLKETVREVEITYPIAQDNDGDTWRPYKTRFWPTLFLIDKQGKYTLHPHWGRRLSGKGTGYPGAVV